MSSLAFRSDLNKGLVFLLLIFLVFIPIEQLNIVLCPFQLLTGIYCPLCGITRSLTAALQLDFSKSLQYHPLGFPLLILLLLYLTNTVFLSRIKQSKMRILKLQRIKYFAFISGMFLIVWTIRLLKDFSVI